MVLPPDEDGLLAGAARSFLALYHSTVHYLLGAEGAEQMARDLIVEALAHVRNPNAFSFNAAWLGLSYVGLRDDERAGELFSAALAVDRPQDTIAGSISTMLAALEILRGNAAAALTAMERSVAIFAKDRWGLASDFATFWTAPYAPALELAGRPTEATIAARATLDEVTHVGLPSAFTPAVQGDFGILCELRGLHAQAVVLIVQAVEQPLSALDHRLFAGYLEQASAALDPAEVPALLDQGRRLSFDEAAALAMEALDC